MKVLLYEPQVSLNRRLRKQLEQDDFLVTPCFNNNEVRIRTFQSAYKFFVLSTDNEMEQINNIVGKIREKDSGCIILLITSQSNFQIKNSLRLGANDFIENNQLHRLSLKLWNLNRFPALSNPTQVFEHKEFIFHQDLSLLQYQGREIRLSKTERLILRELFSQNGLIHAKTLIQNIWNDEMIFDTDRLRTRIFNLRKKIRLISDTPLIKSVKGSGYMLA